MNLTPEQRQIGKDNFDEVTGITRRDFFKQGIAAGVVSGAGIGSMYYGYGRTVDNPVRVGIIGTGDEGNVLIGAINSNYVDVVAIADIRPYNIHRAFHGDYSSDSTLQARPGLMKGYGWKSEDEARAHVKVYTNGYEELLDNADVEGVIIALPLHLHDDAAIKAMRKGKHVLTEKLMAHSVHQCKEMARVAAETKMLLATGHQRHYSVLYDNAVHTIQRGLLGDLHFIRAQWHRGNLPGNDSWQPPLPASYNAEQLKALQEQFKTLQDAAKKDARKKKELETLRESHKLLSELVSLMDKRDSASNPKERELWDKRVVQKQKQLEDSVVQAADHGYQEITLQDGKGTRRSALEELIRWRLWNRTGGGLMAELGSHQLDASGIFITASWNNGHKALPLSVQGVGGRYIFPPDRDVDDHVCCTFEFPAKDYYKDYESGEVANPDKKVVVTYSSINGNGFGGYGETVYGTKGTLILEGEQEAMLFVGSSAGSRVTVRESRGGPTLDTTESAPGQDAAIGKAVTGPVSRGYREEIEHWAWCIRNPDSENKPHCHPAVAMADAVIAHTANLAMKENRRIEFQRAWFDIDSDETPEGIKPRKV